MPSVKVPRLVAETDVASLPLGPLEGFVLSRIDGVATVQGVADATGLPEERVRAAIDRLQQLGAIEWVEPAAPARGDGRGGSAASAGTAKVPTRPPPPGTSRTLYDPSELEESVDLPLERRREVLDTYYRLDELDHYELLGLSPQASKADIRGAYFQLSKRFHPDTLYGKRLGSYKAKMETVFRRLTEAYEVLGKKKKRQEYDAYLQLWTQTRDAQHRLEQARQQAEAIERGQPPPSDAPHLGEADPSAPAEDGGEPVEGSRRSDAPPNPPPSPPSTRPAAASAAERPPSSPSSPRRPSSSPPARRELHARRLAAATGRKLPSRPSMRPPSDSAPPKGGSGEAAHSGSAPTGAERGQVLRGLTSSLKQTAALTGGVDAVERLVANARRAEHKADLVGATNSLRLALAMAPEREDLQAEYQRLSKQLAATLADTYERQARYEEEHGRWAEAALSWSRVVEGRPNDAKAARRAAAALLKAGGDLKRAKRFAQRAVELEPEHPMARRVLGRVFLEAGMKLNARRELEAAAKLDPSDEMVKNLLRELRG